MIAVIIVRDFSSRFLTFFFFFFFHRLSLTRMVARIKTLGFCLLVSWSSKNQYYYTMILANILKTMTLDRPNDTCFQKNSTGDSTTNAGFTKYSSVSQKKQTYKKAALKSKTVTTRDWNSFGTPIEMPQATINEFLKKIGCTSLVERKVIVKVNVATLLRVQNT